MLQGLCVSYEFHSFRAKSPGESEFTWRQRGRVMMKVKSVWMQRTERYFLPLHPSCDTVYLQIKVVEVPRRVEGGVGATQCTMGAFKVIVYCKNRKADIRTG